MLSHTFYAFNTVNTLLVDTDDRALLQECELMGRRFELLFSRFDTQSELWEVNHALGKPTQVSPELALLLSKALGYCEATGGLFDITMGAVCRLWSFHTGHVPSLGEIEEGLRHVDYRKVHVEGGLVTIEDPEATVDLGGIAKGYIADRWLEFLAASGVEHALVNLGGNVACLGDKVTGTPWRIAVRAPLPTWGDAKGEPAACFELSGKSVVTSGVYERSFWKDGRLYHHILDPKTGYPAQTDLKSATVISDASIDGDGYSTALLMMGSQRAEAFADCHPEIEVFLL